MSRHHLSPEAQIELLRRQYFQLIDPQQLAIPPDQVLKAPEIQAQIYRTMFQDGCLAHLPPERYRARVLKRLLEGIERGMTDPELDEISDDLTTALGELIVVPKMPPEIAAQQWHCVTYTLPHTLVKPEVASPGATITLLESQNVIASQGTTGRRTWEAALHLGTMLLQFPWADRFAGRTLIELGAGTGILAILVAKFLRCEYVLCTDGSSEVVESLGTNFHLNGLDKSPRIDARVLKWSHSLDIGVLDGDGDQRRDYDFVLGSDLIYDRDAVSPLVMTISQLFSQYRDIQALISATVRNEATLKLFEDTCEEEGLNIERISVTPPDPLTQTGLFYSISMPIRIYSITQKKHMATS